MDLFGWDAVFATTRTYANERLAGAAGSVIQNFSYAAEGCALTGKFGAWAITGGAAQLIELTIPIISGTFRAVLGGSAPLDGISITAEVSLVCESSASKARVQQLSFDFKKAIAPKETGAPGTVRVTKVVDAGKHLTDEMLGEFEIAMAECLVANASQLSYTFAEINPAGHGGPGWLAPKVSRYCYAELEGDAESYLVILSLVSSDDCSALSAQFDPTLIEAKCNVFFAISGDLFLKNVVGPVLPSAFRIDPSTIEFQQPEHRVVGKGPVPLGKKKWGLITYHPQLQSVAATVANDSLQLEVHTYCDLHAGMSITDVITSSSTVALNPSKDALAFHETGDPIAVPSKHVPSIDYVLSNLLGAFILDTIASLLKKTISDDLQNKAVSDLSLNGLSAVVNWGGAATFQASHAGLGKNLYVSGTLQ